MFNKTIITDFFTTVSFRQAISSFFLLFFRPSSLRFWDDIWKFEKNLKIYLWAWDSEIISMYDARSALYQALKIIWVKSSDEVIINWYTCVSVSNAVIQSWAKPTYSDIDIETLSFDIEKLKTSINKNTKVIVVQHTFWKTAHIEEIKKLASENNIVVIEDCAHSLWTEFNRKKTWTYWDFAIFSTWRDKVISSVTWWFLLINNPIYFDSAIKAMEKLDIANRLSCVRNLMYNIVWYKAYKTYDFLWLWKIIIYLSRKLKLINEILTPQEKKCKNNKLNFLLPNSLAYLANKELEIIKEITRKRRAISHLYDKELIPSIRSLLIEWGDEKINTYRYPILLTDKKEKEEFVKYMKKNKVLLWTSWSGTNIVPIWSDLKAAKYQTWTCPVSEDIASRIITLPNHILLKEKDIKRTIKHINNFF